MSRNFDFNFVNNNNNKIDLPLGFDRNFDNDSNRIKNKIDDENNKQLIQKKEQALLALKQKRIWALAQSPGKNIFMQGFMLYMAGKKFKILYLKIFLDFILKKIYI